MPVMGTVPPGLAPPRGWIQDSATTGAAGVSPAATGAGSPKWNRPSGVSWVARGMRAIGYAPPAPGAQGVLPPPMRESGRTDWVSARRASAYRYIAVF